MMQFVKWLEDLNYISGILVVNHQHLVQNFKNRSRLLVQNNTGCKPPLKCLQERYFLEPQNAISSSTHKM